MELQHSLGALWRLGGLTFWTTLVVTSMHLESVLLPLKDEINTTLLQVAVASSNCVFLFLFISCLLKERFCFLAGLKSADPIVLLGPSSLWVKEIICLPGSTLM